MQKFQFIKLNHFNKLLAPAAGNCAQLECALELLLAISYVAGFNGENKYEEMITKRNEAIIKSGA